MDRAEIFDTVKDLIADITDMEDITEASSLYDELGIDSVDLAELIFACEEEFDIEAPSDKKKREAIIADIKALETVGDIVDYVLKCLEETV